ncbi:MAG: TonB-dependent receptor, partial [Acidobacteriota bacterium]
MFRRLLPLLPGLLLVLAGVAFADGPETGNITGTVTEGSGTALPGVVVTLSGDRGTQTSVTGADGTFRFGLVPPGNYSLKAELEGFSPAGASASVSAGGRYQIDLTLQLGTSEEITATSEAPMVDKFNVTAGATMEAETAGEISASVRSFYGALQVLPGVTNDAESADLSSSRPTVNGALWQESNVYVDGVDTTYSMRGGGTRVFLPTSALSEVSMEAGGGSAEYGRNVGSHTNLIVKSGTNKFHGDLAGVYSKNSWNENYDPQPTLAQDLRLVRTFIDQGQTREQAIETATNWPVYEPGERAGDNVNIEASIGGPLKRDKAWWFVARGETSTNQLDNTLDGELFNNSSDLFATIAKLNFQPAASHSLAATWIDAPVDRIFLLPAMGDRYNATFFDLSGDVSALSWNWSLNENFFLETKLARQVSTENRRRPFGPDVKAQDPRYLPDASLGAFAPNNNDNAFVQNFDNSWHNGWIFAQGFGTNEFPRDQLNLAMTQFAGVNHEIKFGVDAQRVEWDQAVQRPNTQTTYDFVLGTPFGSGNDCNGFASDQSNFGDDTRCFLVDYNNHGLPLGSADSDGENVGVYLRDRFTVGDHWTFNVGLRGEQQTLSNDRDRDVIDQFTLSPRFN